MFNSLMLAFEEAAHAAAGHAADGGGHTQLIDTSDVLPSITAIVVFLVASRILYV